MCGYTPAGGRDGRGRNAGGRYLRLPPSEHSHTVYCNQAHYGTVSGGRADTKAKDVQLVVGEGQGGCGGYADGGLGGGTDGRGGVDGRERD